MTATTSAREIDPLIRDNSLLAERNFLNHWLQSFDESLIRDAIDPDSWAHEESLLRDPNHIDPIDGDNVDAAEAKDADFSKHIHGRECQCVNGKSCQICVTHQDLIGITRREYKVVSKCRGGKADTFVISMNRELAIHYGFM